MREHFKAEGRLTIEDVLLLCQRAREVFEREPNVIQAPKDAKVVGDIHGQFYDLMTIFERMGMPTTRGNTFVFLGDYVDRGSFGTECAFLLLALKLTYPVETVLLRGNHETRKMTQHHNFRLECIYKYDLEVWDAIMKTFDALPVAAVVNGKFLCVHGGIGPNFSLKSLGAEHRFNEPPRSGMLCDVIWSDPQKKPQKDAYEKNKARGCSFIFSFEAAHEFLQKEKLLSVVRGHEVQKEGYLLHDTNPVTQMPSVVTLFSAPNYCGTYKNFGAAMTIRGQSIQFTSYEFVQSPYYLQKFESLIHWSWPFFAKEIHTILASVYQLADESQEVDLPEDILKFYHEALEHDDPRNEALRRISEGLTGQRRRGSARLDMRKSVAILIHGQLPTEDELSKRHLELEEADSRGRSMSAKHEQQKALLGRVAEVTRRNEAGVALGRTIADGLDAEKVARVGHDYDAISDLDLHNEASPFNYHAEDDNDDDAFEDADDIASNADSDPRHDHKWVDSKSVVSGDDGGWPV
jgi:serine/threonine-protein phosphatase 2B catalytic subunit